MAINKDKNTPIMQAMAARAASSKKKVVDKKDPQEAEDVADKKKGTYSAKEENAEEKAGKS